MNIIKKIQKIISKKQEDILLEYTPHFNEKIIITGDQGCGLSEALKAFTMKHYLENKSNVVFVELMNDLKSLSENFLMAEQLNKDFYLNIVEPYNSMKTIVSKDTTNFIMINDEIQKYISDIIQQALIPNRLIVFHGSILYHMNNDEINQILSSKNKMIFTEHLLKDEYSNNSIENIFMKSNVEGSKTKDFNEGEALLKEQKFRFPYIDLKCEHKIFPKKI